jgi:hypothetical protein
MMIKTLHLYNRRGTWLFDDAEKQIVEEPFLDGSSKIITEIQKRTPQIRARHEIDP